MTVIGIVLIIPLLWMVFTSLKPMEEIVRYPPTFFQKKSISQIILIRSMRFLLAICKEHLVYHGVSCVRQRAFKLIYRLWICQVGFSRKNLIFSLVLSTMMIPGFVTMIPQYVLFSKIGWVGTYLPLIIPSFFWECLQYLSDAAILLIDQ